MTMYEGIINLSVLDNIQTQWYILHLLYQKSDRKKLRCQRSYTKEDLNGWGLEETHWTQVTQVLKSSQTYLPREKNASIFLNVEDASVHRSTVLCRHSMFHIKVVVSVCITHSPICVPIWYKKDKKNPKTNKKCIHALLQSHVPKPAMVLKVFIKIYNYSSII